MALHRYGDFPVEVFYFDSPCSYGRVSIAMVADDAIEVGLNRNVGFKQFVIAVVSAETNPL